MMEEEEEERWSEEAEEVESDSQETSYVSPETLELPDPSVLVDDEFAVIWRTSEIIGALSKDAFRWSITSILLGLLYSGQDTSQWFLQYATDAKVNLADIARKREFSPQELPQMRRRFSRGGRFRKKKPFTSSTLNLFQGAVDLYKLSAVSTPDFLGARHLLGAYLYRLPSGHLNEILQYGFVTADWSAKFVEYVASRNPGESLWLSSHQQLYGSAAPLPPVGTATPGKGTSFQVMAPDGPAEFSVSDAVAQLLRFANLHRVGDRLTAETLFFAAFETAKTGSSDGALLKLSRAVSESDVGWKLYDIALPGFFRQAPGSPPSEGPGVPCTDQVKTILAESRNISLQPNVFLPNAQPVVDLPDFLEALLKSPGTEKLITLIGLEPRVFGKGDVLGRSAESKKGESVFLPLRADFTADNIPGDPSASDRLDFKRDVRAFASVIASRELTPPMSIGIFGDWGSGKSFFMRQLEQKIKTLVGRDRAYCSHVVTVWFNAWHYVDQNLWATLVTEIFDKLFTYIRADRGEDAEARLKTIEEELSKERGLHTEAKADLAKAEADRQRAETELKSLREIRKKKENRLSVQLNDVAQLVVGSPEVKKKLDEVEHDLGLPVLDSSLDAFEGQVNRMQSLGNRAVAIFTAAFREPGWGRRIGFLLIVLGLPAVVAYVIGKYVSPHLNAPAGVVAGIVTFLVSATFWMRSIYVAGSKVVSKAETTLADLKRIRERRAAQEEAQSIGEIEVLREREGAARQKIKEAESKIQALQAEAKELQPGRRLQRFIEQRFEAGDYRQHLGLISLIRRDLETLSRLLRDRQDLPVDRIVLFIDDLDRCPPERVCEVLEAIHLILAFELFVVVVGVDVRWVAKSLQKRYSGLLEGRVSTVGPNKEDLASPEDYLEKIFQVPFWINPLGPMGSRALAAAMLAKYLASSATPTEAAGVNRVTNAASQGGGNAVAPPVAAGVTPSAQSPSSPTPQQESGSSNPPESAEQPKPKATVSLQEEDGKSAPLTFTEGEQKFALELSEFGGTSPRRLKRFINLYRVIKSTLSASEVESFLGSSGEEGDYKLVMVLLAILTGSPAISGEVLRKLQQPGAGLHEVLRFLSQSAPDNYRSSLGAAARLQSRYDNASASAVLARWASVVARYSFHP